MFVGGCAVGPNLHLPQTAAPANWSEPQLGGETNAPPQVVDWWETFNDPELDSLVERAVKANYDLQIAEARVRESRATQSHAKWDFAPTVDSSAGYTKQKIAHQPKTSEVYDASFDASWEIDVFGSKRRSLESATANLSASQEDLHDVLITVLGDVA